MNDVGDGPLPDHGVVESQVGEDLPALPKDRHVQHHPLFHGKVPLPQLPQGIQLTGLQLRHEPQASHIDAQDRDLVQSHQFGQVQNRAVPAEGNQQVRVPQLLEQGPHLIPGEEPRPLVLEGGTYHRLETQLPQDLLCGPGDCHALVPIGVGTQDNLFAVHWLFPSPRSCKTWWDSATSASRSNSTGAHGPFSRYPRYSIFPSGPRMGE